MASQREQLQADQNALIKEKEQFQLEQKKQLDANLAASFSPSIEVEKDEEKSSNSQEEEKKRIVELEGEVQNLREIVQELEAELESERNQAIGTFTF